MNLADPAGPWQPLPPTTVSTLFASFPGRWCLAGGWALDLFIGYQTRDHADTDILVLRSDLPQVHRTLSTWELFGASDGQLTPWPAGADLARGTHDIWCRRGGGPWEFQLMVGEATPTEWRYRRDRRINGPIDTLIMHANPGLPILAPEIQLLYKSRAPRPKDEQDFHSVLPKLGEPRRRWLGNALRRTDPGHAWIDRLKHW